MATDGEVASDTQGESRSHLACKLGKATLNTALPYGNVVKYTSIYEDIRQVCHLTHPQGVVIAPPFRFSVVEFSKNGGNHVKVSTSLRLLLAHLGFFKPASRPPATGAVHNLFVPSPPKKCAFFYVNAQTRVYVYLPNYLTAWPAYLAFYQTMYSSINTNIYIHIYIYIYISVYIYIYLYTYQDLYIYISYIYIYIYLSIYI